jgi:hypothetical protein
MCAAEELLLAAAGLLGRHGSHCACRARRRDDPARSAVAFRLRQREQPRCCWAQKGSLILGPVFAEVVSCPAGPRGGLQGTQKATIHNT